MTQKHLVFIINPKSGVERQKEIKQGIERSLDQQRFSWEIQHTEYPKHGTELARQAAANGAYAVVAVGGDGSVNDIIQGLQDSPTRLAIIPKGSGNGMARTLKIPLDTDAAIHVINADKSISMDLGLANGKPFISNAGVAFDALISKKFAKSTRRGLMMYSWLITKYMWLYKSWDWTISIDGKELKERAFVVNVANGQQFGYNFRIAPDASCTDGLLDVVIIRRFPKILGASIAVRGLTGTIYSSPFVQHYRGKEITVSHPSLNLMQSDGDAHACTPEVHFRVKPGGQTIIVP